MRDDQTSTKMALPNNAKLTKGCLLLQRLAVDPATLHWPENLTARFAPQVFKEDAVAFLDANVLKSLRGINHLAEDCSDVELLGEPGICLHAHHRGLIIPVLQRDRDALSQRTIEKC